MAELSLFPPQRDRSNSAATGLWTSHPHVAEIGSSSQDWTDIDFETCLDLAFAALIWAYTGDDSPCFVSTHLAKADRRRFSHVLKAGVTTTLAEAVRSIRNVGVLLNDAMEAPSMLVHVPRDQGCFDNWTSTTTGKSSIPLQLFAEREGGTSAAPYELQPGRMPTTSTPSMLTYMSGIFWSSSTKYGNPHMKQDSKILTS